MRANDFLVEVGDSPYELSPRWRNTGMDIGKSALLPSGKWLDIAINVENRMALINFHVGGQQRITGNGDAIKIFSTVGAAINDYAKKKRPHVIAFTGILDDNSRIRLYDRLANRWLTMPGLKGYVNLTDHKQLWPQDLVSFMDDNQDIRNQKIYVLASPVWMRSIV